MEQNPRASACGSTVSARFRSVISRTEATTKGSPVGRHRAQCDVGRELAALLTAEPDAHVHAHGARRRRPLVSGSVLEVPGAQALRDQFLDRPSHQLARRIAGDRLDLIVDEHDPARQVGDDDRIRGRLEELLGEICMRRARPVRSGRS